MILARLFELQGEVFVVTPVVRVRIRVSLR